MQDKASFVTIDNSCIQAALENIKFDFSKGIPDLEDIEDDIPLKYVNEFVRVTPLSRNKNCFFFRSFFLFVLGEKT